MIWISAKDQLPPGRVEVLCYGKNYDTRGDWGYFVGYTLQKIDTGDFFWVYGKQEVEPDVVTHWMALPEAPRAL